MICDRIFGKFASVTGVGGPGAFEFISISLADDVCDAFDACMWLLLPDDDVDVGRLEPSSDLFSLDDAPDRLLLLADDTMHDDEEFMPLASDDAEKCSWEFVGVAGWEARRGRAFDSRTGPSALCSWPVGVLEWE